MTYQLYTPTGSTHNLSPISVPDNAISLSLYDSGNKLGIQLVGRNAIDYGTAVAQNTVQMVSNFAGTVIPSDAIALQGQLWFNVTSSQDGLLYVRTKNNPSGTIANWEKVVTEDANGIIPFSVNNAVAAAGNTQGTATLIAKVINVVVSATAGVNDGVKLPVAVAGYRITIKNNTAVSVDVYPNTGAKIEAAAVNDAVVLGAGAALEYFCTTGGGSGQWFALRGVYA